jgi:hypothetical protein
VLFVAGRGALPGGSLAVLLLQLLREGDARRLVPRALPLLLPVRLSHILPGPETAVFGV